MPPVIPPTPGPLDQAFWDGVARRKLLLRRCATCGTLQHPPTPMCGSCNGLEWDDQEASGRGTVYTWIVSHHPSQPDAEPRIVVLVELEEGVRLVSNLQGIAPEDVRNDLPVELTFAELDGGVILPQFVPAGGS
jgi:uncharacterized OB-fold protein